MFKQSLRKATAQAVAGEPSTLRTDSKFRETPKLIWANVYTCFTGQRSFATSSVARASYEDTIRNLAINSNTKVMVQGFTGKTVRPPLLSSVVGPPYSTAKVHCISVKQGTFHSRQALDFGSKYVCGVSPSVRAALATSPSTRKLTPP